MKVQETNRLTLLKVEESSLLRIKTLAPLKIHI